MSRRRHLALWLWNFAGRGTLAHDSDKDRIKKIILTLVAMIVAVLAIFWGSLYVVLGYVGAGLIPLTYALISFVSIGYFFSTKKFELFRTSQLLLLLLLPFLLQAELGGFANGSAVMIWAFFAPLAAVLFADIVHARAWLLAFLGLTIVSGALDSVFAAHAVVMPHTSNVFFFVLNMGFGFISIFFVLNSFVVDLAQKNEALVNATTELRNTNQALDLANRSKSEFVANMSHEIRTPLTAINGFGESLLDPDLDNSDRLKAAESIVRNGKHLLGIINDILDFSKVEAGKLTVELLSVSPIELMQDVETLLRRSAEDKGLKFLIDYKTTVPDHIMTDPLRLRQILLNLCANAIKFTSQGSVVVMVSCDRDRDMMTFEVVDTGVGLSDAEQSRLFAPFSQADASTTRRFGGTGLGLYLSKRLAELLGGTISVKSHKGIGSRFNLTTSTGSLRDCTFVDASEKTARPAPASIAPKPARLLSGHMLIADDNADNRRLLAYLARKFGPQAMFAENGEEAVRLALEQPFDLVLMDMQMPVMDGVAAVKALRAAGYSKPIIALTANVMNQERDMYATIGCNGLIPKPIQSQQMFTELSRFLPSYDSTSADAVGSSVGSRESASAKLCNK